MLHATIFIAPECDFDLAAAADRVARSIAWLDRTSAPANPETHAVAYVQFVLDGWELLLTAQRCKHGPELPDPWVRDVSREFADRYAAKRTDREIIASCEECIVVTTSWDPERRLLQEFLSVLQLFVKQPGLFVYFEEAFLEPER